MEDIQVFVVAHAARSSRKWDTHANSKQQNTLEIIK